MNKIKVYIGLFLCLLSWFSLPIAHGKPTLKIGHSKSFHGIETIYCWSYKSHTAGLVYVYHLGPYWHTKGGVHYSTGNLLKALNTYHWNMANIKESFFPTYSLVFSPAIASVKHNTIDLLRKYIRFLLVAKST